MTNNTDTNIGASTIPHGQPDAQQRQRQRGTDSGTVSVTGNHHDQRGGQEHHPDEAASTYTGAMALKAVDASVFNNTATNSGRAPSLAT
ncbi:MAG: hypothetical protein IPK34_07075 [Ramlibacter sp.]|nr:hypothetical protein [Ramlibacter sp.]